MRKRSLKALSGLMTILFALTTIAFPIGPFALQPKAAQATSGVSQGVSSGERIYGADRYETAAKIAREGWKEASEIAILSAGMDKNLVDALAAAPLAKLKNAPILLTQGDVLNTYAEGELKRLGVKTVYVTAGEQVITKKVLDRLAEQKIKVIPLGGKDRFETAVNIAKEMGSFNKMVVATARSNADALSISSIAAAKGMPILLSETEKIPTQVKNYIDSVKGNVDQTYILGGEVVLTNAVKNAVPNGVRIGGKDRFATNLEILKFFANDLKYSKVYLANGEDKHLVDALTGAPLAAQTTSPLLLTGKALPGNSKEYAKLNLGPNVIALGGVASVAEGVLQELQSSLVYSVDGIVAGSADPDKIASLANTVKITGKNVSLKNAKTDYSVYIHGDNALLDNVTIGGTLFIDPGAHGTANINNVKAGKIVVLSGAKESIHLRNTEAGTLLVSSSSEVRVESSGTTRIGNIVVNSYVILDAAGGTLGTVEVVSADGQEPVVTLRGSFDKPIVVSGGATIKADPNSTIAELRIAPENKNQKISLDGKFDSVVVNKEAQVALSATTSVKMMVANVKAELNVPAGASIETLDKKGNDVAISGSGNVGGQTPAPAGGGGGGITIPASVRAINSAGDRPSMLTALIDNAADLGIEVSEESDYGKMHESRQPSVGQYVLDSKPTGGYTTAAQVKAAFNAGVAYESAKWAFSENLYYDELNVVDFDTLKQVYINHGIFRGYTEITDDEVYKGAMKAFEVFEELSDAEKEILIAYLEDTFDANDGIVGNAYRINTVFEEMRKWELESAIWVPESGLEAYLDEYDPELLIGQEYGLYLSDESTEKIELFGATIINKIEDYVDVIRNIEVENYLVPIFVGAFPWQFDIYTIIIAEDAIYKATITPFEFVHVGLEYVDEEYEEGEIQEYFKYRLLGENAPLFLSEEVKVFFISTDGEEYITQGPLPIESPLFDMSFKDEEDISTYIKM